MTKKIIAVALAVLMLAVILPANAAIQATSVEIRGEVFDNSTVPPHTPNATGCVNGTSGCVASWNGDNFAGFWYDLENGLMSENMTILNSNIGGKSIGSNNLTYDATTRPIKFEVAKAKNLYVEHGLNGTTHLIKDGEPAGRDGGAANSTVIGGQYYAKIGWQAEEYVALNAKANKLAKLIWEDKDTAKRTLTIGDVWDIGDGYTLTAQSIDTSTSPRQAWIVLSKDGVKLDDKIITQGQVYTYTKESLGSETKVPVFVTYVDSVFAGATTDILQLKYTWAISTSVTEIKTSDKYGAMEVIDDGASDGTINLANKDSAISLSRNSVVDVMGKLKFKTADSDDLRFMPIVTRTTPGIYVKRGEVYSDGTHFPGQTGSIAAKWNAYNFAGFWYDLTNGQTSENMTILTIASDARSITSNNLTYDATIRPIKFEVAKAKNLYVEHGLNGTTHLIKDGEPAGLDGGAASSTVIGGQYYAKIGWRAEEYVALNAKANKLAKLIWEDKDTSKHTLTIGDVWDIGDGYTLSAQSIDTSTSPRQAWIVLSKDGVKLDDKIITQGQVYTYTKESLGSETKVPVFVTYVDSVFAGATTDILQLKYTWAISTSVTEIKTGDKYGAMEVIDDGASDGTINLANKDSAISLSRNSVVDVMGNLKFSVADSNTSRFYPSVEYEIVGEGGVVTPGGTPGVGVTPRVNATTNVTVTTPPVTVTTAAAAVTTAAAAATTKKTEPGFEAIFAIAGLLAVAFLVLRQRK